MSPRSPNDVSLTIKIHWEYHFVAVQFVVTLQCHNSIVVILCPKFNANHIFGSWMGWNWNFHGIRILIEKIFIDWILSPYCSCGLDMPAPFSLATIEIWMITPWALLPAIQGHLGRLVGLIVSLRKGNLDKHILSEGTKLLCNDCVWNLVPILLHDNSWTSSGLGFSLYVLTVCCALFFYHQSSSQYGDFLLHPDCQNVGCFHIFDLLSHPG